MGSNMTDLERARKSIYRRRWNLKVNALAGSFLLRPRARVGLYRRSGMDVRTEDVQPGCWFFGFDVAIGEGSWIGHRCYFDSRARIEIGRSCAIAAEVMLCTSTHQPGTREKRAGPFVGKPIRIGDGIWIGTRVVVLPGVTVGDGCVIAAGSEVT
jgi:maltose O-acetyltransferase